jgi:osmotically-inducible protein OsmY
MKTNEDLQREVQEAIKWEPLLNAAQIGVIVVDGIVTLTGSVDSYSKKMEAEDAAKTVSGIKAFVQQIDVVLEGSEKKEDSDIAAAIINSFKLNWEIPVDKITVTVESGWVTLQGELKWHYQKEAAKKATRNIFGVKGITNDIVIKSEGNDSIEKKDILQALTRNWSTDDQDIHVNVAGNKVTLNGTVDSLYQKEQAEKIAWNAPGVWLVANELDVEYDK